MERARAPERPERRSRRGPLLVALAALAVASWAPFRPGFEGPRRVLNGAQLDAAAEVGGLLELGTGSVVRTPGPADWLEDAIAADGFELAFEVRTTRADQSGPARILTVSRDWHERNLTLGQAGSDLVVRLRRPGSDADGSPPLRVPGVFAQAGEWRSVRLVVGEEALRASGRRVRLTVDGRDAGADPLADVVPTAPLLGGWDPELRLAFGDELVGSRPFEGAVRGATLRVGDGVYDLLRPERLELPASTWHVPERARRLFELDGAYTPLFFLWHALLYAGFGVALALAWPTVRAVESPLRAALGIALVAAPLSVGLELGKLLFAGRHPSLLHIAPDVFGAALGALLLRRLKP